MTPTVKPKRKYQTALRQEQAEMTRQRIMDAARRLLLRGSYASVRMEEIAQEAGVAYQTVYAVFGSKLRLAQAIIEAGWPHVEQALELLAEARASEDPEVWLRMAARVTRRIQEPCADLVRFMRESGDPNLLARYRAVENQRHEQERELASMLEGSRRLRTTLSTAEALGIVWALTGPDWYNQIVFQRGWTPDRFEQWLGQALIDLLLEPAHEGKSRSALLPGSP